MKIKETELKNSKIHELVYINPACVLLGRMIGVFKFASKYFSSVSNLI